MQDRGPVGTLYSMASELLAGGDCTPAPDMCSLGVVVYLLLANKMPFFATDEFTMVAKITEGDVSFHNPPWRQVTPVATEFVSKLLNKTPDQRLTAEQVNGHLWLKDSYVRTYYKTP